MNAIVPASGGYMTIAADDLALLQDATQDMGGGGGVFLKHDGNTGEYTYGSANEDLPEGSLLAADFSTVQRGWICWKEGSPVDEVMISFRQGPPPPKHTLTDHGPYEDGDGWSEQAIIELRMLEAPFTTLTLKVTGVSKLNAFGQLMKDYVGGFRSNPGLVPVIELGNQEFQSKAKGAKKATKYAPVFKIVEWRTPDELAALVEGGEADYAETPEEEIDAGEELVEAPPARTAPRQSPARQTAPARQAAAPARAPAQRGRF